MKHFTRFDIVMLIGGVLGGLGGSFLATRVVAGSVSHPEAGPAAGAPAAPHDQAPRAAGNARAALHDEAPSVGASDRVGDGFDLPPPDKAERAASEH